MTFKEFKWISTLEAKRDDLLEELNQIEVMIESLRNLIDSEKKLGDKNDRNNKH